MKEIEE
jgi:hypothetical protein